MDEAVPAVLELGFLGTSDLSDDCLLVCSITESKSDVSVESTVFLGDRMKSPVGRTVENELFLAVVTFKICDFR